MIYSAAMLYLIAGEVAMVAALANPTVQVKLRRGPCWGGASMLTICFILLLPIWLPLVLRGFSKQS